MPPKQKGKSNNSKGGKKPNPPNARSVAARTLAAALADRLAQIRLNNVLGSRTGRRAGGRAVRPLGPRPSVGKKSLDPRLRSYMASVLNPFSGPISKGLTVDRSMPMTNVIRRRNTVSVNLTSAPSADLAGGVEFVIVLNDRRDPYIVTAHKLGSSPVTVTTHGLDVTDSDLSIPDKSYARIVSAGVRITYLGNNLNRGGSFYQFARDRETGSSSGIQWSNTFGDVRGELARAVATVPVPRKSFSFIHAPEATFAEVDIINNMGPGATGGTLTTPAFTGLPTSSDSVSVIHLYWQGPAEACNFSFELVETIEYYHTTHRHFATPSTSHPQGLAVQQAIAAHMQKPGSGNSSPDHKGLGSYIAEASAVVGAAAGLFENTAKAMFNGKGMWNVGKALWNEGASMAGPLIEAAI